MTQLSVWPKPLLLMGVFVITIVLVFYPFPQQSLATSTISEQNLFVKSNSSQTVPPPLRIVEDTVLKGNRVPGTVQPQTLGSVSSKSSPDEIIEYEVKSGESLWSIAEKFDISLNTILWTNGLTENSTVQPGQKLTILPVSGLLYSVNPGDTISELSQTYGVDPEEIVRYNHLENEEDIYAGDLLILPHAERPASVPAARQTQIADSYFINPVQGVITQGPHGYGNGAVDIANDCGRPVVAAAGGTVRRAGTLRIAGNTVTILHDNGVVTLYGHLSTIAVSPGQRVNTGDIIGYVGNTGYTLGPTGCHVHFAVRGAYNFLSKYPEGTTVNWE